MRRWLFIIGVAVLLLSGCGQSTPAVTTQSAPNLTTAKSYQSINVTQLKSMLDNKDFLLVNVHIPYEGEIKGTDLFIPYNEIERNLSKLPADKGAKIVVYCRSDRMSGIAAKTLTSLGFTNITDVEGGFIDWEKQGYPLVHSPQ